MRAALLALALGLTAVLGAPAQAAPEPAGPSVQRVLPATLVELRGTAPVQVVKTGRPGQIRVTNPNDTWVKFLWGTFTRPQPNGQRRVEAYRSVTIQVDRRRVDWIALLEGNQVVGEGSIRGIRR